MSNKITWDKLVEFNDGQPIQDAIKMIDLLTTTYEKFIHAVESSQSSIASDLKAISTEASQVAASLNKMSGSLEQNEDLIMKSAKASEELVKQDQALKMVEADNAKQLALLTAELEKLKASKDKLQKSNVAEEGSLIDLKKQYDDSVKSLNAMGTATKDAIKQEQIDKVKQLGKQYTDAKDAIKQATQSAMVAAGSYNELSKRVAEGKKELKAMEGGLKSNSVEFKNLQKFVKEGSDELKEWDEAVGDNQRHVGAYKDQIAQLIPGFSQVAGSIDKATAAGKLFTSSPLGIVIGAIALAVGSLVAYFKGSIEGQDRWNKIVTVGSAVLEVFLDGLETIGEALVHLWDAPEDALNAFVDFLKSQVLNRFFAIFRTMEAFQKLWQSNFTEGWKDLGNAILQSLTGVENVIDKVAGATTKLTEEMARRLAIAEKLANLENKIRKEKIKDVVDDANTELEQIELLEKAKDKLTFSDEQRLAKVRKARKLLNEQTQGDIELAQMEVDAQRLRIEQAGGLLDVNKRLSDYTTDELKNIGVKYEMLEQLAQLEAAQTNISSAAAQKRKALLKQELQLIAEIAHDYFDRIKREKDADTELNQFLLNNVIHRNQEILDNEDASLNERIRVIEENTDAGLKLLEIQKEKEIGLAQEAALQKVQLNDELLKQIYNDTTKSLTEQIQAEHDAREVALQNDEQFAKEKQILETQLERINDQYVQNVKDTNDKSMKAVEDNVFKVLARDQKNLTNQMAAETDYQLQQLNEAYQAGAISLHNYEVQKQNIIADSVRDQILTQISGIEEVLDQEGVGYSKRIELEKQLADLRLKLSENSTKEIVENEKRMRQQINAIQVQAFDLASTIVNASVQQNVEALDAELAHYKDTTDARLKIVGDDKQAQALIEQDFANKQAAIQAQIAQQKRKAAIFEKAKNATQIVINTARAVVETLPNIPLSILIGALGGLQLAKVLATPIPAFAEGTDYAPGGAALVAERGREIGIDPSGNITMYKKKQITQLQEGTQILTNKETEQFMKDRSNDMLFDATMKSMNDSNAMIANQHFIMDTPGIINAIHSSQSAMVEAIQSQPRDIYDERGHRVYERKKGGIVRRLDNRYKLQ